MSLLRLPTWPHCLPLSLQAEVYLEKPNSRSRKPPILRNKRRAPWGLQPPAFLPSSGSLTAGLPPPAGVRLQWTGGGRGVNAADTWLSWHGSLSLHISDPLWPRKHPHESARAARAPQFCPWGRGRLFSRPPVAQGLALGKADLPAFGNTGCANAPHICGYQSLHFFSFFFF